jgi:hypothetical protein
MANVGNGAMVAAGSVVSSDVRTASWSAATRRVSFATSPRRRSGQPRMNGDRVGALDWLKAAGITIIVWGHVIGVVSLNTVSPILIKQFGVAFFVFVTSSPWRSTDSRGRLVARHRTVVLRTGTAADRARPFTRSEAGTFRSPPASMSSTSSCQPDDVVSGLLPAYLLAAA